MSFNLKLSALAFIILIMITIILILRKDRMYLKYSLVWFFSSLILLLVLLIPGFLVFITNVTGFEVPSNMIFAFLIAMLIFISISLTVIVSSQNEKIKLLIQEVSILKNNINNK